MWVSELKEDRFILKAEFINEKDEKIHATDHQTIVYTNLRGLPQPIPVIIKSAIESKNKKVIYQNLSDEFSKSLFDITIIELNKFYSFRFFGFI